MPANSLHAGAGSTPIPDPTQLTTEALKREIAGLKELMESRLDAANKSSTAIDAQLLRVGHEIEVQVFQLKELHDHRFDQAESSLGLVREAIGTRFDGMDKAVQLLQAITDALPARVDEKITAVKGLHEERFNSIQKQFQERDVRTEQSSKDSKVAVDAALQAAKEAVGEQNKSSALAIAKSEASTMKQIDQMTLMIQTGNKGMDDKFDDIKERLTRIEGKSEGSAVADTGHREQRNFSVGIAVAIGVAVLSALITLGGIVFHYARS